MLLRMPDLGNKAEHGRDEKACSETYEQSAAPRENKHIWGKGSGKLANRRKRRADAEVSFPTEDGSQHAAYDHTCSCYERVHRIEHLDL